MAKSSQEGSVKKEGSINKLPMVVLVPVAIALVALGTSPLWSSKIAAKPPTPQTTTEGQNTDQTRKPEVEPDREIADSAAEQRYSERLNYRPVQVSSLLDRGFPIQGTNPEEIAFNLLGRTSLGEGEQPSVVELQPFADYSVVIVTNDGSADDSVGGNRYRLEFEKTDDQRWQLVWAGTQQRCRRSGNPEEWTTQLCP